MTLRLAIRSLLTRPVRSAVLACGFGFGIAVMAALLGVGEVILDQAQSPALVGGGDVIVWGAAGSIGSARFVTSRILAAPPLAARVRAVSPSMTSSVYLIRGGQAVRLRARGGIPGLERAVDDPETAGAPGWVDAPSDQRWISPDPGDVLRAMDRFHPVPEAPEWDRSWAEWLYFNGRSPDGSERFYLTFLAGPRTAPGQRLGGVRLQLERNGVVTSHATRAVVSEDEVLSGAPDLTIGSCRVRLEGMIYRIDLDLPGSEGAPPVRGSLSIAAQEGRSMPPFTIRGARGWVSGYTVPVLSGDAEAHLQVGDAGSFTMEKGTGYHDHNWGFWEGVVWQWGQVAHEGLSFVYGRVHPPPGAADPDRIPGFLGVLGFDGPLGYSTNVTIEEESGPALSEEPTAGAAETTGAPPKTIRIRAHGPEIDLALTATVESAVRTRMGGVFASGDRARAEPGRGGIRGVDTRTLSSRSSQDRPGEGREGLARSAAPVMSFFQLRARFHVTGTVAGRTVDFTSLGSAETFRGE